MSKCFGVTVAVLVCVILLAGQVLASNPHEYIPGQVIVKFKANATPNERAAIKNDLGIGTKKELGLTGAEVVDVRNYSVPDAVAKYKGNGKIEYIEPDYLLYALEIPNDPRFDELWGLNNTGQTGGTPDADIDAPQAWDVFTGSSSVIVVVIDTGYDYNHPDLAANVWTNPGEIAGNGVDDDGNGYIDDIHGWDFYNNDNDPFDDHGHGTHCSGTIGGVGNNGIGVAGVNWTVKIMGCKFLGSGGTGPTSAAVSCIQYALTIPGVKVMSNSWGGGPYSAALEDAIEAAYAQGVLFVCAAGNYVGNTDINPNYPSCYDVPNVMSIGATDHDDEIASFSGYGAVTVDLFAPGVDVLSTTPGNSYSVFSGTSMACPHTSGVAALVWGRYPGMTCDQVKALIMNSVDPKPQLAGMCVTGGRLNALFAVSEPDTVPPEAITDVAAVSPGSNTLGLTWTATGDDGLIGTASVYDVRYSTSMITEANFNAATKASGAPDPGPVGTPESMTVKGLDFLTTYYFAVKALDEYGNAGPISNIASGTTLGAPDIAVDPTSLTEELLSGGTSTQTLTIYNMAEGTLDFEIPQPTLILGSSIMKDYLEVPKGEVDPRVGDPVIEGQGGPDAAGYRWIDSDELGGPVFDWVDITTVGTSIPFTADDSNMGPYPIGFTFEFYGNYFDSFRMCTNGWISFTSTSTVYSNQPLPNSGAPENLIAPFWDDLTFVSAGDAYYYNDGTRLIIEWYDVPHFSTGGPYTFQVILYPNGEIVYQYLSMAEPTNSATVGIQNDLKDDGLEVAFNTDYIHDGLAIRIGKIPQWLAVTPTSGTVFAGGSTPVSVDFESEGLLGGYFYANIVVNSNDPDEPSTIVPVELHVVGAPDIAVSPLSIDFGSLFVGASKTANLVVSNPGTDNLDVTSIVSDNSDFTVDLSSFTVTPRSAQTVVVTFTPSVATLRTGTLTITSNDPDEPTVVVSVQGTGLVPPQFSVTPTSVFADLMTGETESQSLTITNDGGSDLAFTTVVELYTGTVTVYDDYVEYPKDEVEPAGDPQTEGSGGPDVFGYSWIDSDEPGGPTFDWVEISGIGTEIPLTGDDQNLGWFPIGFNFPFYGNTFSEFRACSNGWLSFTEATRTTYTNYHLPSTSSYVPKDLLAVFWDDLDFRYGGEAYYHYDGMRTIIEYKDVPRRTSGGPYTFEVILYPSGKIVFQYLSMQGTRLAEATIGIQNADGTDGLEVVYNGDYVHDDLAIKFAAMPEWLSVSPASGTVPPGGSIVLSATFNATDLFGGDYLGAIHLDTNDPNVPRFDVPAHLHVTGAPDVAAVPDNLDFGSVYLGYSRLLQFTVVNQGTDMLNVHDIVAGSPEYTVDETDFSLAPLQWQLINVVFVPSAVGDRSSTLTIMSDDPDEPSLVVPLAGAGLIAPDIAVTPTSLSEDLLVGQVVSRTVRMDNSGGSDLDYQIGVRLQSEVVVYDDATDYPKDEAGPPGDPQLLGSGGPDAFGYRWIDSDEPGGPIYDWIEIDAIGTEIPLTGDDQNTGWFPIGFEFPFYGNTFTEFRASSNGWLSFTETSLTSYTNYHLPNTSSSAPKNLLAPFWDDLTFTSAGDAYYYYDGLKTIIEYEDVPRLGTGGGPYTFQVILYPTGKIVFQYLSMQGTRLDEATIGIQNADGTDGLEVVYNAEYVHDEMAIEFSFVPEWLSVNPPMGTVPAGGFVNLSVLFNTTELFGGDYHGGLNILSNDPDEGLVFVPCDLHVTGAPDIDVTPLALDFDWLYIGLTSTLQVTVYNAGTDLLDVTSITIDNPEYTVDTTPFTLAPRDSMILDVTFTPVTEGVRDGILAFFSNDADEPEVQVSLTGIAVIPPEIEVDPTEVCGAALPGMLETKTLRILNTGGSDLNWTAGTTQNMSVEQYTYLELGKEDEDPRPGILGSGGPDAFGYTWIDSDEPGGPTYDWVDISGIGTQIIFSASGYADDANVGPFPIGFSFDFYGNTFTEFRACTNGFVSFTHTDYYYGNQPLPNAGYRVPENLLAVLWDDLVHRSGTGSEPVPSAVYYYNDGTRLIIQYQHMYRIANYTDDINFQIILYPGGKIVYQYGTMVMSTINSHTIGIQNATRDDGLTVVFNDYYVHEEMAIEFSTGPQWLSMEPLSGVVPAGGYEDVTVIFDASMLGAGEYTGFINISSNDLDNPMVTVPVVFNVGSVEAAYMTFEPNTINLGSMGEWVDVELGIPASYDPNDFLAETAFVTNNGVDIVGPPDWYEILGPDEYGVYTIHMKFDRSAVQAILPVAASVQVWCYGEIDCITYVGGSATIKVIRPMISSPNGGESYAHGGYPNVNNMFVMWEPPQSIGPDGSVQFYEVDSYSVYFSADGGQSWQLVVENVMNNSVIIEVPNVDTEQGLFMVCTVLGGEIVGYDMSDNFFTVCAGTAGVPEEVVPKVFALAQNTPNPFSGTTMLRFDLPRSVDVRLSIFDVRGRLVKSVIDHNLPAGRYSIGWDGTDASGGRVASGVYFYTIEAGPWHETMRMVVIR